MSLLKPDGTSLACSDQKPATPLGGRRAAPERFLALNERVLRAIGRRGSVATALASALAAAADGRLAALEGEEERPQLLAAE